MPARRVYMTLYAHVILEIKSTCHVWSTLLCRPCSGDKYEVPGTRYVVSA